MLPLQLHSGILHVLYLPTLYLQQVFALVTVCFSYMVALTGTFMYMDIS